MNNRNNTRCVLSTKDIIRFVAVIVIMLIIFLFLSFYDSIRFFSKDDAKPDTYTVVDIETERSSGRGFPTKYSIMENSEGKSLRLRKTYKDKIGRQVEIYTFGGAICRKDAEMNDFGICGTVGLPVFIIIVVYSTIVMIRFKKRLPN